jgi:D-alanyl-D-alanine-carboxypeptidase/D-alanyl-D-alanine-endopeptidase
MQTVIARQVVALALTCVSSAIAQQAPRVSRDSVQRVVRERVSSGRSPGLAVGVLNPDGSTYIVWSSRDAAHPVNERSIFEIGSITKAFTGILLADLVLRGVVSLDQPVAELLPADTRIPSRGGKVITLAHLSTQTSGLPRLPGNLRPADQANPYADYTVRQLYDFLGNHELRRDPGAQYEYTNLGVGLLGHALAVKAGGSYEQVLRERVLAPLGMSNTGIAVTPAMTARATEGHNGDGSVVPWWDLPTLAGAGALRSSVEDMLRLLKAMQSPPDNDIGRAIRMSMEPRFTVNGSLSLGLNWHISNFQGDTLVWHNGGTAGYRTILAYNTRTRAGAVLLGNSSQDNEDIVRHLLMGTPLVTVQARKEIAVASSTLAEYIGKYEFGPQFAIEVTLENGQLFAQATQQPKFRIYPEAPDKFFLKVVDAQLEFARDAAGRVTGVTLVQGGRNVGRRVP